MHDHYGDDPEARADALADAAAERQSAREDAAEPPPPCVSCAHFDEGERQTWDCPGYPPCCEAVGLEWEEGGDERGAWTDDDFEGVVNSEWASCPHWQQR